MSGDITIPHLTSATTDTPVRGYIELRSGETGIVLNGGQVLVCKSPRLLSKHASTQLINNYLVSHRDTECGLAAISNMNGPSREQTLARRREETQSQRDRKTVVINEGYDVPDFTQDAIGLGTTDVQRQARTEALSREIRDV